MSIELAILKNSLHQIGNCLKTLNHFTGHEEMIAFLILLNIEKMSGWGTAKMKWQTAMKLLPRADMDLVEDANYWITGRELW